MNKLRGLWRGKRLNDSEWVQGLLMYRDFSNNSASLYQEAEHNGIWVDPSTLGECTGLRDKNGKLIFEGDILRHNSGTLHEVVFEQRNDKAYFGWVIDKVETWQFDWDFLRQLEVVGNIHDDPGLISERTN